ncbi:MAG: hypothetical protein II695_05885, partial [Oscillospiraceae bacterium]|nr:hypothetical protein [Oscillospiraceae bacterium]
MKKAITAIICAVLFSACAQTAQTEVTTVTTTVTTETTTETALTVTTTTASVSAESSAAETTETTESATEATTETTTETTTATEKTTAGTSSVSAAETSPAVMVDEEKQRILDEMPDIVFVMSEHFDNTNIYGFYVTKTGDIKMYDFRSIAPNKIYEIPDVYDRLEEATCEKIE